MIDAARSVSPGLAAERGFLASTPMRISLAAAAVYCLGMALAWAAFSTQMPVDWAFELILTQQFKPFYAVSNPPLYSWIAWALQRVVPPGQGVLLIVNYAATFALFWLIALAGHRLLKHRVLAALAPWSLFVIIPYGRLNFGYVNTQPLLPLIAATVLILLALGRRSHWSLFVALGLVMGLGTLAKLNYLFAVVCLLAAAFLEPRLRTGLARPWIGLSLLLAIAVVAPFAIAFHEAGHDVFSLLRSKTANTGATGYMAQIRSGLADAAQGIAAYAGPAALIAVAGAVLVRRDTLVGDDRAAGRRFLRNALIAGLVVLLAGIFFFGTARIKIWYLHAFFLPAPLYALTFWDGAARMRLARTALCVVVLGFAVFQTAMRFVEFTPYCPGKCRDVVPYDRLAQQLRAAGFERGTILGIGVRIGGNLRGRFPRSRVGVVGPDLVPPRPTGPIGQCLVIWRDDEVESLAAARRAAAQTFVKLGLVEEAGAAPVGMVRMVLRGFPPLGGAQPTRSVTWRYILIPKGNARCG